MEKIQEGGGCHYSYKKIHVTLFVVSRRKIRGNRSGVGHC